MGTAAIALCASGCGTFGVSNDDLSYIGEPRSLEWYTEEETKVAHSNFCQPVADDVALTEKPRTIADRRNDTVRDISLGEAIQIALTNNKIVQTGVSTPVGGKAIFSNPDNIASVYDQAINETGVLFGRRSVEAALSDFDATVQTSMTWGRSRTPQNSQETGEFSTSIGKQFATGASLSLFQTWDYLGSNSTEVLFPSSYTGRAGLRFRQPLLAGGGAEFTRIAGPVNPNFGAITGVSQGVLIARINSDISLTSFEASVRDSVRDVQRAYWDLFLAYRNYNTAVVAHRSTYQTWKEAKIKLEVGTLKAADEAQALEQFYGTQATVESSLNTLYQAETALRRLMGVRVSDDEILRPSDKPSIASFEPDWRASLTEALTRRVELRRQKWTIKSLQFQLRAARSLVQPQLDLVSGATLSGFGDRLLDDSRADGVSGPGNLGSAYTTLGRGDYGSWDLGVEFSVPLGFRSATSQVRNYELRVAKARAVLSQIEREIAHDVTTAIQDIVANYTSAETNRDRLQAAQRRVDLLELERIEGTTTLDLVLRAQVTRAQAESQYYSRIVDFTKAMIDFEYAKGSLLAGSGVQLAEGGWDPAAYNDALRRAQERTYAFDNDWLSETVEPFASPTPLSVPEFEVSPGADSDYEPADPPADPAELIPKSPAVPEQAPAPPDQLEARRSHDLFDWDERDVPQPESLRHVAGRSTHQSGNSDPVERAEWQTVYEVNSPGESLPRDPPAEETTPPSEVDGRRAATQEKLGEIRFKELFDVPTERP